MTNQNRILIVNLNMFECGSFFGESFNRNKTSHEDLLLLYANGLCQKKWDKNISYQTMRVILQLKEWYACYNWKQKNISYRSIIK